MSRRCPKGMKFDGRRCIKSGILVKQTYDIITEESAREGSFAESGWEDEEGERFENAEEAAAYIMRKGATESSSIPFSRGTWYSTYPDRDMYSGEERIDSFHISNATLREEHRIYELIMRGKAPYNR